MTITASRRSFLGGLLAAPVIVRAGALMPVRSIEPVFSLAPQSAMGLVTRMRFEPDFDTAALRYSALLRYSAHAESLQSARKTIQGLLEQAEMVEGFV